jgi:hypothetical protein
MQIQPVNPNHVHQLWGQIEHFFKAAYDVALGSVDCTLEQLKLQLVGGAQTLLVAVENNEIKGVASMSVITLPNHRVATITAAGGKGITNKEVMDQVVAWAKSQGATKIKVQASGSRLRLYQQQLGLIATETVVEKLI